MYHLCRLWIPLISKIPRPPQIETSRIRVADSASATNIQNVDQCRGQAYAVVLDGVAHYERVRTHRSIRPFPRQSHSVRRGSSLLATKSIKLVEANGWNSRTIYDAPPSACFRFAPHSRARAWAAWMASPATRGYSAYRPADEPVANNVRCRGRHAGTPPSPVHAIATRLSTSLHRSYVSLARTGILIFRDPLSGHETSADRLNEREHAEWRAGGAFLASVKGPSKDAYSLPEL